MSTKSEVLRILSANADSFVSGETLAEKLSVSRSAVCKAVGALKRDGYEIEGKTNHGYRISGEQDVLSKEAIESSLEHECEVNYFDVTGSTNDLAKKAKLGDTPVLFVANKQTGGRGRLGRSFESPAGTGLYLTLALRPKFDIEKSLFVTMIAAVATVRAIRQVAGVDTKIKWVNDIFHKGKKVCGILTEAQSDFESGHIDRIVIGIGVNCFPGIFPEELKNIAGSIAERKGAFSRSQLASRITDELLSLIGTIDDAESHRDFLAEYREKCFILGYDVKVHRAYVDDGVRARAIDIDESGGLTVEYLEGEKTGQRETLRTGEVSVSI